MQAEAVLVEVRLVWIVGVVGSLLSGVVSGLVVSWLKEHVYWRKQKRSEQQYSVFIDAVQALGRKTSYLIVLKSKLKEGEAWVQEYAREETPVVLEVLYQSEGLVHAFFTEKTSDAFMEAATAPTTYRSKEALVESMKAYRELRREAILAMAAEVDKGLQGHRGSRSENGA